MPLVLGGVPFDHPRGLAGHSDGDVVAHALTDAVLGAAGLGDIGSLFPSGDERTRRVSLDLLAGGLREVREAGWELVNADCVLIGEEPRIAALRDEMRPAARRCARGRADRRRAGDHDRRARLHRPRRGLAAQAVALLAVKIVRLRRSPRPAGAPLRGADASRPSGVHERERPGNLYWGRLYTDFPDFQVALVDGNELLAEAHAIPLPWDGRATTSRRDGTRASSGHDDERADNALWRSRSASPRASQGSGSRAGGSRRSPTSARAGL